MKDIGAITIDTSVFDRNGRVFDIGALHHLKQFSKGEVEFILSDVVLGEIKSHLKQEYSKIYESTFKALKDLKKHGLEPESLDDTFNELQLNEVDSIVENKTNQYLQDTNAEIVNSEDYTDVNKLLNLYFNSEKPFGSGKKKNEFPDAIALLALNDWADDNQKKIIVVSHDNDWKGFCESQDNFVFSDDIKNALEYCQQFKSKYNEVMNITDNDWSFILEKNWDLLQSVLTNTVQEAAIHSEAYSGGSYFLDVESHAFYLRDKNSIDNMNDIHIIDFSITEKRISAVGSFSTHMIVDSYVEFYQFHDKEQMFFGDNKISNEFQEDIEVWINLQWSSENFDKASVTIDSFKITQDFFFFDLGEVERSDRYYQ